MESCNAVSAGAGIVIPSVFYRCSITSVEYTVKGKKNPAAPFRTKRLRPTGDSGVRFSRTAPEVFPRSMTVTGQ
jgi:hypothetical protein